MNNKQKVLKSTFKFIEIVLLLSAGILSQQAQAALPANAILNFSSGVGSCQAGGTYPVCDYNAVTVLTGSYFAMDMTIPGFQQNERHPITTAGTGINLAGIQSAGGIDKDWTFGGNYGRHLTLQTPTIVSQAGNVVMLSMTGWTVNWGSEGNIDMGTGSAATVTCGATCADGDTFTLDYTAVVPTGSFTGINYALHLQGTIKVPSTIGASNVSSGTLAIGGFDVNDGVSDGRITMSDLTSSGITDDSGYTFGGGLYNFNITGLTNGAASEIMIPLTKPIPANAIYRKLVAGNTWKTFTAGGGNLIASAAATTPGDTSTCPAVGNAAYNHSNGLVKGDECIELTIVDGGTYDYDGLADGTIKDPGGVATAVSKTVDTSTWGTSGCSMSKTPVKASERADWWLVAGFLAALGGLSLYRRHMHIRKG